MVEAETTRDQVLRLIVAQGPIAPTELADRLGLTAAGVRRHVATLEADGMIAEHQPAGPAVPRRGRPARYYITTDAGRARLHDEYSDFATSALHFLAREAGDVAVGRFAASRGRELEERYARSVAGSATLAERVDALAERLSRDGYAATVRKVGSEGFALQLCQGHCPVEQIAREFPQLCEEETKAFSRLLDVHLQRLATLADGEHVCTTHIPLIARPRASEGTT